MITLRPYQREPVRKAIDFFREDNPEPALMVFPTGWGKSLMAAEVAAACPDPILVVQPTKELLEQNLSKYRLLCGELAPAGIYSASFGKKQIDHVTFATIGSIKEVGETFKNLGFRKMLIDEAHLYPRKEQSMLGQFLKDSQITQVLGITATPLKLENFSEKQGEKFDKWSELILLTEPSPSGSFFKKILHVGQIQEMTSLGFWSPLKYEILDFDPRELRYNDSGSEYSEAAMEMAYRLNNIRANIYGALNYHLERRHCLVFVPSVEEAYALADGYEGATAICGQTPPKERAQIINDFKSGKIRVIVNVGILSTGFDYTKIDMIVLGFSTASVSKYYQILGRGVRIDKEKTDCVIVDMGGNVDRFGYVEDIWYEFDRKWRMYGSGGRLLSGIPVNAVGTINRDDVYRMEHWPNYAEYITFGKHKGKRIEDVPMSYRTWLLKTPSPMMDMMTLDKIRQTVENYVRNTRNEPPAMIMPDGKHAGANIGLVPRQYLAWYYHSKEWNETNDSLRRGIEIYYKPSEKSRQTGK